MGDQAPRVVLVRVVAVASTAALAGVLLLAGCGSSANRSTSPSAQPAPTSASPTASASGSATPSASAAATPTATPTPRFAVVVVSPSPGTYRGFRSPTGNIRCSMGTEDDGTVWARCDVGAHTWALPPRPAGCAFDWAAVARVSTDGRRGTVGACVSDAAGGDEVLAYGHALRLGALECRSSTAGTECATSRPQHGFFLSRSSYRVW